TYAGAKRPEGKTPIDDIMLRAAAASDTKLLLQNYATHGVYILHGEKDDNVPVDEARTMKGWLGDFHRDFVYHEQPGVTHWWSNSDEPGAACVDWPPMFDFFARHSRPSTDSVRQVDFTTVNPGISSRCYWLSVEGLKKQGEPGRAILRADPWKRRFSGTTTNISRLALDLTPLQKGDKIQVEVDGQKISDIPWPEKGRLWLQRDDDKWAVREVPSPAE